MVEITDVHRQQFQDEGYFILDRCIPDEQLQMLRDELDGFIEDIDADMDRKGIEVEGINHKGKRYFIALRHKERPRISEFLYSDLMAEICKATIGDPAWLFWEQYVVKAADVGMKFEWHQDSGYLAKNNPGYTRPYLTCWCALDDVDEQNGTIYVLPYSRAGSKGIVEHIPQEGTNDLVGYTGDDPGEPVIVPAGSIAVFSTTVLHRSGANHTNKARRSYIAQYSPEPILRESGDLVGFAEPFLPARA